MRSMAATEIPVGYGQWVFETQHAGIQHTAITVLGFKVATPPYTQGQCTAAGSAWATAMAPLWDAEVSMARVIANIGNDGPPIRFESIISVAGSRASQVVLPPNLTYLVRKTTAFGGRRYRGRMYIPFVSNADLGNIQTGQLASGAVTLLQARATAVQSGLVAAGPNASELSLLHASGLSTLPSPTTVATLAADDFVATQRRRLVRQ